MTTRLRLISGVLLALLLALPMATARSQSPSPKTPALPAIVVPAKVIEDPSVRTGWRRYQFGDEPAFSVILPGPPEATAERMSGTSVVNSYFSNTDTASYGAVRITELGRDMERDTEIERQAFFKSFIEGFAKGFQESMNENNHNYEVKLLDTKKVTAAGREAFQQDLTVGPFQGSAQLVFAGSGAFCVLSVWNPQTPAADREAFLNSFRLIGTSK